jgi:hypothetical protein
MVMFKDTLAAVGQVSIRVYDSEMKLKDSRDINNLVVTLGKNYIVSRMKDASLSTMTHMALGVTNTAAAIGNTALVSEVVRVALTATNVTTNSITYTATYGISTPSSSQVMVEAGIFNASSAGLMLARTVFGAITKNIGDTITVSWSITIG